MYDIESQEIKTLTAKWDTFKRDQAGRKKLSINPITNELVQQPGISVKEFVGMINGLSEYLVSLLGITDAEQWESFAEIVNNATAILKARESGG